MASVPPRSDSTASLPANAQGIWFGPYAATDFVVGTGAQLEGATTRQARWYFRNETVAMPKAGLAMPALSRGASAAEDLRAWLTRPHPAGSEGYPPVVWVAAPHVIAHARIDHQATQVLAAEGAWKLALAPRLPLN